MTGVVEWPLLITIASCILHTIGIAGGVIIRVFTWIYTEANNLRTDIGKPRSDVSQTYASIEAQRLIKDALDDRGDRLENAVNGLSASVDRLGKRQGKARAIRLAR